MENNCKLINIHSHILPQIDDGAKDIDMAIEMLKESYSQGVDNVILSYHFHPDHSEQKEKALSQLHLLESRMEETSTGQVPHMYLGSEILYDSNSISYIKSGQAFTLANSKYVLIEFLPSDSFGKITSAILEFKLNNYRPIIAHAERYECLSEISNVKKIVDSGGYIQINARNFLTNKWNLSEKKRKKRLIRMLQMGLVHFIADDCHDIQDRGPCLGHAFNQLRDEGQLDEELLNRVFIKNQQKILDDEKI